MSFPGISVVISTFQRIDDDPYFARLQTVHRFLFFCTKSFLFSSFGSGWLKFTVDRVKLENRRALKKKTPLDTDKRKIGKLLINSLMALPSAKMQDDIGGWWAATHFDQNFLLTRQKRGRKAQHLTIEVFNFVRKKPVGDSARTVIQVFDVTNACPSAL